MYIKNIFSHRTIISVIMLFFILGFSLISLNTGINFIQNKDSSESYESLVNIALNKKNNVDIQREISEAEDNIANGLYFKMLRNIYSTEYAYGDEGYIEAYIVNNDKPKIEKQNFGLHMICGSICLCMAFFQFWPYFRRKFKKLHRIFGGVFIVSSFTLCISVWFYLVWSGTEKTYEQITGQVGLYSLSAVAFLSICISIFYLFRREYNKHMGWMAIAFGSFLTAPFQRYDWMLLGFLEPGKTHAVINGWVDSVLYTQAYFTAYLIFFMNRHYSPLKKSYQAPNRLSEARKYGIVIISILGSISVFYYYFLTQGMIDSESVLKIISSKAFVKENQVIFNQGLMTPFTFAFGTITMMIVGAFLVISEHTFKPIINYHLFLFLTASVVVSIIELYWGLDIGYPTMLNSPGGGYYVLWGLLHFIFSVMVLWAYVMKKTSLLKEWITMLWILSFFSVMIFWLAKVISLVYEVPPIYVEGRHLSVLLTGGVSELIFLCAMLYAIYGSATKERAIY